MAGRRDLHDDVKIVTVIAPVSVAINVGTVGAIIDRQNYEGLEFLIQSGLITSGTATFTVLIEDGESPTLADNAPVPAANLLGSVAPTPAGASFTFANPSSAFRIGYIGAHRYVRLTLTTANNAAAALLSAVAVLFSPKAAPTP